MIEQRKINRALEIRPVIIGRLFNERCQSLDDSELWRCFKDCCGPNACMKIAQFLRDTGRLVISDVDLEKRDLLNWRG